MAAKTTFERLSQGKAPLRRKSLPPEQVIFRQLAQDYSAIEVPNIFEAASMQLIALGLSGLRATKSALQRRAELVSGPKASLV